MLTHQRMSPERYLGKVEPAMRHLFAAIEDYLERSRNTPSPLNARSQEEHRQAMAALEGLIEEEFSVSVLCGSVIVIADQIIDVCSTNVTIPTLCESFTEAESARFCIGRERHGLPLGAIIHAGRHQFTHWKDEREWDVKRRAGFSKFTQGVFDHLLHVRYNDPLMDLVYDLGNEFYRGSSPIRSTSLLLTELGWTGYNQYLTDMQDMFDLSLGGAE